MNKLQVEGSGFPATNYTWRFIQTMLDQLSEMAVLGGRNYILGGCAVHGSQVDYGFIVISGELMPFYGGTLQENITVIESVQKSTYLEDKDLNGQGDAKDTYFSRHAEFGTGGESTHRWEDFEPLTRLDEIKRRLLPPGTNPQLYTGSVDEIPSGWYLCDGRNGTPNLSGKFLVGLDPNDPDYNAVGKTGGKKSIQLSEQEMPQHKHSGSVYIPPHSHNLPGDVVGEGGSKRSALSNNSNIGSKVVNSTSSSSSQTGSITTNNAGGNQAHENRPPYYTLAYIIYMG